MILFINPLATPISCIIIENTSIVHRVDIQKNREAASLFPRAIVSICDQYPINEICCLVGPGGFTLMRIVTLTLNALHMGRGIIIKGASFFEMIDKENYIPILDANPREYIIYQDKEYRILEKGLIDTSLKYSGILSHPLLDPIKFVEYRENVGDILRIFSQKIPQKTLAPIYIKEPHITTPLGIK